MTTRCELALSLSLAAVCLPFYETRALWTLAAAVGSAALNHLLRKKWPSPATEALCAAQFAHLSSSNALVLTHEMGHAAAARLVFQTRPQITMKAFGGGMTRYAPHALTNWGAKLGYRNAILSVVAAGPLLAVLVGAVVMAASLVFRKSRLSNALLGISLYDFHYHCDYALSALGEPPSRITHDFVRLRGSGLHPVVAATMIAAIPLLILMIYNIRLNCSSDKTETPSSRALASLEPASSPART